MKFFINKSKNKSFTLTLDNAMTCNQLFLIKWIQNVQQKIWILMCCWWRFRYEWEWNFVDCFLLDVESPSTAMRMRERNERIKRDWKWNFISFLEVLNVFNDKIMKLQLWTLLHFTKCRWLKALIDIKCYYMLIIVNLLILIIFIAWSIKDWTIRRWSIVKEILVIQCAWEWT